MGTRSLTIVRDEEGRDIVVIYRQMDGYFSGMGADLANILNGFVIVNGLNVSETRPWIANGMGCLAAQLVANLKDGPGGIYLCPPGTKDVWEEYIYIIEFDGYDNPPKLTGQDVEGIEIRTGLGVEVWMEEEEEDGMP